MAPMKNNDQCLLQRTKHFLMKTGLTTFFITLILGVAGFIFLDQYIKGQLLENARAKLELSIHPVFNSLTQIINTRIGYLEAFTKLVEADSSLPVDER